MSETAFDDLVKGGLFCVSRAFFLRNNSSEKINSQNSQTLESGFDKNVWVGFQTIRLSFYIGKTVSTRGQPEAHSIFDCQRTIPGKKFCK